MRCKMENQLLKKFCAYLQVGLAFIALVMMFSVGAKAQIVYTEVLPDSTMYCAGIGSCYLSYNLDVNNDANYDFTLEAQKIPIGSSSVKTVSVTPLHGNAVRDTLVDSIIVSMPLPFNAIIDSNLLLQQSWQTSGLNALKVYFNLPTQGLWDNVSDYYLGLRLLQSGQTYYGWVRLRVDVTSTYASLIIRDYAYNTIPNQPILAGQTMTTAIIENTLASSMNIFPNPASNELTTNFTLEEPADVQFVLYDIVGNLIVLASEENYAAGPNRKEMNVEQVPSGIYQLAIKTNQSVISRKVIVQH